MANDHPFLQEKDVVYFLVETRKMLDRTKNKKGFDFSILRFYCDWILHTEKTYITKEIKLMMDEAAREEMRTGSSRVMEKFIDMEELKNELNSFIVAFNLLASNIEEAVWLKFHRLLIQVLSDQPMIINTSSGITRFEFKARKVDESYSVVYDVIP